VPGGGKQATASCCASRGRCGESFRGGGAIYVFSSRSRKSSLPRLARSWSIGHFENFWSGEKEKFFSYQFFLLTILFMYFRDFNPFTDSCKSLIK